MKKEGNKRKELVKLVRGIIGGVILTASAFTISGCEIYHGRRTYPRTYYFRNSYPSHLRGTLLDPYPPGRRGYQSLRLIRPLTRIIPRRPFRNSPYGEHYRPRVRPHSKPQKHRR